MAVLHRLRPEAPLHPTTVTATQVTVSRTRFKDRGAALLWTVQQLPTLQHLDIVHDSFGTVGRRVLDGNGSGLPWCSDLSGLQSRSLTQLHVDMLGGPPEGNTLRLDGLPELRSLSLAGSADAPLNARIDNASFQGTPQLRSLRVIWDQKLQLQSGSLAHLTALTSLTLAGCGLRSLPADVASLSASLCELDLGRNDIQIDAAAMTSLLLCSRLSQLDLLREDIRRWEFELDSDTWQDVYKHVETEGYFPARFSSLSLKHLMQLPLAFYKLHHRELDVWVTNAIDG